MRHERLTAALKQVDEWIEKIACEVKQDEVTGPVLLEAVKGRGKMLRPCMLLLCAWIADEAEAVRQKKQLCRWGAIVELAHMTSLIHDDVIDQSELRRGRETLQKKFGNPVAVYAGDYLLARLLRVVLEERNRDISLELTHAVERMCKGEIAQYRFRYQPRISIAQYEWNIAGKTGMLFEASCKIGAMAVGKTGAGAQEFARIGQKIGRAFQFRDDLMDFISDEQKEGKQVGKDFEEGIYTLPVLLAREHKVYGKEVLGLMEKNACGTFGKEDILRLRELVILSGSVETVRREIERVLDECRTAIKLWGWGWAQEEMDAMLNQLKV